MAECPITLEIPTVPVIAPDGFVYQRSALMSWFRTGRGTSPSTGAPMSSTFVLAPDWYVRICRSKNAEANVDPAYNVVRLKALHLAAMEVLQSHGLRWANVRYSWEARMESAARGFVMCMRVAFPGDVRCDALASILNGSAESRAHGWSHFCLVARFVVECEKAGLPVKLDQLPMA